MRKTVSIGMKQAGELKIREMSDKAIKAYRDLENVKVAYSERDGMLVRRDGEVCYRPTTFEALEEELEAVYDEIFSEED